MPTPNVFLMSSTAGHNVAEALAMVLSRNGRIDAKTWQAGQFQAGVPFMDTLRLTLLQYDFGINVLTPDDVTTVRGQEVLEPRDNVIFELGLFLGARGRQRAFPLLVSVAGRKPSLPSDLKGVKVYTAAVADAQRSAEELVPEVERLGEELAAHFLKLYQRPEVTILPSTGLAIGYFHNFILPVMQGLKRWRKVQVSTGTTDRVEQVDLGSVRLTICIPDDLRQATRERWKQKGDELRLSEAKVDPGDDPELPRAYPFRIGADVRNGKLEIFDTPTTLLTARHVVRRLLPDGSYDPEDRAMAEEREIHNFERTLRHLLEEPANDWFSDRVRFVAWRDL